MRKLTSILLASSLLCALPAMAGKGHEHGPDGSHMSGPITSETATKRASKHVKTLVEKGKLDKSWAVVNATGATQKDFGMGPEWVVSFKNAQESDPAKQTLYVFYTVNGAYIASNFTGK